jgi:hypothetical protein
LHATLPTVRRDRAVFGAVWRASSIGGIGLSGTAPSFWLLNARTRYEPGGTGLSSSVLSDEAGTVGTGAQTLLISPR